MDFFSIEKIAFEIWGNPISYVELIGTAFGLLSVYLASRANILTWGTGIVNEVFLFILFFQVQLYADMFLQVYFFIVTLYGWYNWKTKENKKKVSKISPNNRLIIALAIVIGTILSGYLFKNIHSYLPSLFTIPAAYPFVDSFIMVSSIAATILLAKKKIENWYLWLIIDIVCVILYFIREVYFLSLEYFIFLGLVAYGLYNWKKLLKNG
ncbi:nicotinamide riboside transporter PnuC [Flammeovirgaceae bacterium SG7u.111]|nr:nicotinamide riboside transporter PnuC [Flammeovirgaceae bacterium SG7u.132]WPO37145.1 nicotinamide riboside transporter PnuC [Flammeovirgaceae bacterium SG7u.111]